MKKRILVIGTYPIVNPQHGGQHRVSALVGEYKKKFNTKYVALYRRSFYPDASSDDIAIPEPTGLQSLLDIYTSDVHVGKAAYEDLGTRARLEGLIKDFKPNIIHIEQVFPYFGIRSLLKDLDWKGKLIYGSQNVEYELKRDILSDPQIKHEDSDKVVAEIKSVELEFAKKADLVIACTDSDGEIYTRQTQKIIIANNGIALRFAKDSVVDKWRKSFEKRGITKPVLYIGSAHPPNMKGFHKMVGFGLGFLPDNARLLLLGGVSDALHQELERQPNYIRTTFNLRADFLGRVSEDDLAALLVLADTIILPITEGGGSNLKTAEAILANTKVVGTTHAFRSYEQYSNLPNISIADSMLGFRQATFDAVRALKAPRTALERKQAEGVTWEHTLAKVVEEVEKL